MTEWQRVRTELNAIDAAIQCKQDEKAAGYSAYCYSISPVSAELRRLEAKRNQLETRLHEIGGGRVLTLPPKLVTVG